MKRAIYFVFCVLLFPAIAFGDGGTLRLSQRLGDWQVSVFTSPAVLRAGPIDISVLVQDAGTGQVREDIPIVVRLNPADQSALVLEQQATAAAATNKLFRAALFELPRAGIWQAKVSIGESQTENVGFDFEVGPPPPAWMQLAPWVGWPLVAVPLFLWHQRMVSRRERGAKLPFRLAGMAR